MKVNTIDGLDLEKMLKLSLEHLKTKEQELNDSNVFPVSDGDTGTNMRVTLENGIRFARTNVQVCNYLKGFCDGALLGARGNSGAILSQFFRGFYNGVCKSRLIGPGELRRALIYGYREAYRAVFRPVEGTALTVMREGIEHIRTQITRNTTIESFISMYVAEMKKSLSYTPNILPILKSSNVVDSGAKGFVIIFEGMLKYFYDETALTLDTNKEESVIKNESKNDDFEKIDYSTFTRISKFADGYCLEFILQLLNDSAYEQNFEMEKFSKELAELGDSIVAVYEDYRIKVHIHTLKPAPIISLGQRYGEFLIFKLENMQIQHNTKEKKANKICIITAADGEGFLTIFKEFGCEVVIDANSENVSVKNLLQILNNNSNCDKMLLMPNSVEFCEVFEQAVQLSGLKNVEVLPAKNQVECYFALGMDIADSNDLEYRTSQMRSGCKTSGVVSIVDTGDELEVFVDDKKIYCNTSEAEMLIKGLSSICDIEDIETCLVFRGADVSSDEEKSFKQILSENLPNIEFEFLYGGQKSSRWLVGIC